MTTALEGIRTSVTPRPLFTLEKNRYLLYRSLGGSQGRSGQVRKISSPPGFDPRTVQPVASRYTDWATRPTILWIRHTLLCCKDSVHIHTESNVQNHSLLFRLNLLTLYKVGPKERNALSYVSTKILEIWRSLKTLTRIQDISLIWDKTVTTQNLAFLSYWHRKKRLQMHF